MQEQWRTIITADQKRSLVNLKELWYYKDLITLFVKRNFKLIYKQTILGPLWLIINPLITSAIFTVVFGNVAGLPTDEVPKFLFYMAGANIWNLFSSNVNGNSSIFISNRGLFDKVYFPRIVMPITTMTSNLLNYFIQLAIFVAFWLYFFVSGAMKPSLTLILIPFIWVLVSFMGAGIGLIISALTKKYRDLQIMVGFGVSLWMYLTPIVYPLSEAGGMFKTALLINPMGPVVETVRHAFFGSGFFPWQFLLLSVLTTSVICFFGLFLFSKTERTVMDTI